MSVIGEEVTIVSEYFQDNSLVNKKQDMGLCNL